ncbi:RNA methyltransferase TrmH, group 1 [Burkholderiales bacterium GJ-E10]|nr:RNA methyltransferase TrmH, group 1 [Burkholderiales bacterium GJ-E10]
MGFSRLVVVQPRTAGFREDPEALAFATSAADVLAGARRCDSLAEALEGVQRAYAMSGYARGFGPEPVEVREAAREAAQAACRDGAEIAFVFGTERTGLTNEDVQRCHAVCAIPADPLRASLNLAQAAQIAAYESRRELLQQAGAPLAPLPRCDVSQTAPREEEPAAGVEQTEAMFGHLERALIAVGYLDPAQPKNLMARMRRLLLRARPTRSEVDILRGIAAAMERPKAERVGSKRNR